MSKNISELMDNAAEGGVISTLIYHPEFLLSDNNLQPRFFYLEENQLMFWAINELVSKGVTKIDALNLQNVINSNKSCAIEATKVGITNIQKYIEIAQVAARGTYEEYRLLANTVISLAFRRELCALSSSLGRECFNMELSLDDLNDYVNNGIDTIAQKFIFGSDTIQLGEKIDSIWEEICNDRNDDGSVGIPNLIPSLDEFYTFGRGELVLVAGETGRGKSSYLMAQATFASRKYGIPIVVCDSELTDKVYIPRLLANLSGVAVKKIRSGYYTNEEENRIKNAIEYIKKCPGFVHEYVPVFSKLQVDQICRKWFNKGKLGMLVYDYIKPSERYGAADISQGMGIQTDYLKSVAGNLNIPVLGALQLNKLTGTVADSQKPEKYADVLMFWKPKTAEQLQSDGIECGNFCMQVVKNRNGCLHREDDYCDISFNGDLMKIVEAKKHQQKTTPFEKG